MLARSFWREVVSGFYLRTKVRGVLDSLPCAKKPWLNRNAKPLISLGLYSHGNLITSA